MKNIKSLRANYGDKSLSKEHLHGDPIAFFKLWLEQAIENKVIQANAMTLSTYSSKNGVSSRVVLLKELEGRKFIFYTNYLSQKGLDIDEENRVGLSFFWVDEFRQVKISGVARKVSQQKSIEYFQSRPFDSQAAALASKQSEKLISREVLINEYKLLQEKKNLDKPDDWGGYEVEATSIEFWQGRDNRLHDRIACEFLETGEWSIFRKYP